MSAQERARFNRAEQWQRIYRRDRGACVVCGRLLPRHRAQAAHLIANSKEMRSRYGDDIVNHDMAQAITCPGRCNDVVQVTHATAQREYLATIIEREDYTAWHEWLSERVAKIDRRYA